MKIELDDPAYQALEALSKRKHWDMHHAVAEALKQGTTDLQRPNIPVASPTAKPPITTPPKSRDDALQGELERLRRENAWLHEILEIRQLFNMAPQPNELMPREDGIPGPGIIYTNDKP